MASPNTLAMNERRRRALEAYAESERHRCGPGCSTPLYQKVEIVRGEVWRWAFTPKGKERRDWASPS